MYPDEFYELDPYFSQSEVLNTMFIIVMAILSVASLLGLLMYVFQSIGLYSIAKRRGIKNPWLAWLPIGNYWIAGSISDQYRYVVGGEVKNRRIILLVLVLVGMVLSGVSNSVAMDSWLDTLEYVFYDNAEHVMQNVASISLVGVIAGGIEIALMVFWHMALYDLYTSCDPKNNVLFLVLGIVFGVTVPFFIFANRKKDLGMPPRRPEPQTYQNAEPRTYQEPWENV